MKNKTLICFFVVFNIIVNLTACSHKSKISSLDTINVDNGDDIPTLDPALSQDVASSRVLYNLFEGLTSFDQKNQIIPGLAESWNISADKKTYTFHLRPELKFSDGTPIQANDVVFTWQRLVAPSTASPYNFLANNIVNGQKIIDGKLNSQHLAVIALDPQTIQFKLNQPDDAFLEKCSLPNVGIISQANLQHEGNQHWGLPGKIAYSGAYQLTEYVVQGHVTLSKNLFYYDKKNVTIKNIRFFPITDASNSYSQYQSGNIDITYMLPVDQYKTIKKSLPNEIHTVNLEAIYYYDLNMKDPKFRDNPKLRQALSMAIDRNALTKYVLGQGQQPLSAYVTKTIENGAFHDLSYPWMAWPRTQQLDLARQLFREAGYGPNKPLTLDIKYNTNDGNKKVALAVGSMWQDAFGETSIQVNASNQEWKTFLKARNTANYDIARDGWIADYSDVRSYTNLFLCKNPQNNSKYCNPEYDKLITQAESTTDTVKKINLTKQALLIAMNDYAIIPLYQYTYYRLVNPRVKNYTPENNHLDHILAKWYKLK